MIRILVINLKDARFITPVFKVFLPPKKSFLTTQIYRQEEVGSLCNHKDYSRRDTGVFCWLLFIVVGAHVRIVVFSRTI